MSVASYRLDPDDPRAPSQEQWDAMSEDERKRVVAMLPSELPRRTRLEQKLATTERRATTAEERATTAEERAAQLAQRLRELGVDPDG